ncbi:hypothetical protein [Stutzerimonas stutzeri]|uniref:hypothetical protein n=1 Tax=Stutzerimonas stutzeri TaxID=316 RepID=UPI0005EB484B|nr:hypothetical protein [Stutzerimonas stutzeri]
MAKVYLVWNSSMTECVGFTDIEDAQYAATGERAPGTLGVSTLADDFRDIYDDDDEFDMVEIDL